MFEMNDNFLQNKFPEPSKPAPPMPECKPVKPTVYDILISTHKLASQGMRDNFDSSSSNNYERGKFDAYYEIIRHLETQI